MQLPSTATLAEASTLVKAAEAAVMSGVAPGGERSAMQVDASALAHFDTSVLAVLLHARRLALGAGRAFELTGAPEKLGQLARLYGVGELLGLAMAPPSASPAATSNSSASRSATA